MYICIYRYYFVFLYRLYILQGVIYILLKGATTLGSILLLVLPLLSSPFYESN